MPSPSHICSPEIYSLAAGEESARQQGCDLGGEVVPLQRREKPRRAASPFATNRRSIEYAKRTHGSGAVHNRIKRALYQIKPGSIRPPSCCILELACELAQRHAQLNEQYLELFKRVRLDRALRRRSRRRKCVSWR